MAWISRFKYFMVFFSEVSDFGGGDGLGVAIFSSGVRIVKSWSLTLFIVKELRPGDMILLPSRLKELLLFRIGDGKCS